ncbi:hypothetical protein M501DRAFT_962762 [Patellaria atrata CBS 101060]|uniref:Cora-domain-containing protein n=1 Tax=Patellaria atrata CBS 101060 TaxID=1346257 RepID=A0A9P4S303_9PEZI|nr:hypothetical protein M501DRAFT_962762 [Patellaria atrata CBS 101060]
MSTSEKKGVDVQTSEITFSRLEASLAKAEVVPRPNSREMKDVNRHAKPEDIDVNELDFDYDLDSSHYPLGNVRSLQQVFSAVQHQQHLSKKENFSDYTAIECFSITSSGGEWQNLDEARLRDFLEATAKVEEPRISPTASMNRNGRRMLLFLVPLTPTPHTSFGNRIPMTQASVSHLFHTLGIHSLFLLNLLGRPDYWAPQTHWETAEGGDFVACDFFCQHPRWNLQVQGAPLSVYMRFDATRELITYIVSHKVGDTSVKTLKNIIDISMRTASGSTKNVMFLDDPFDFHTILSVLSFEASKFHVKRFQRFMWTQINKVDDHLGGLENSDRAKLRDLTKELQIISQNADSHIGNADVAIITARGIRSAHARIHVAISSSASTYQRVTDSIEYIIKSMEKQKIWFLNYKNRKDSTMSLVYNLVTQEDAANNIRLSHEMKRDSTSMNAIAGLTMVFLPGTFTATVLGAGIFSAVAGTNNVRVSGIWWLWIVLTVPLTLIVMACWWYYKYTKERPYKAQMAAIAAAKRKEEAGDTEEQMGKSSAVSFLNEVRAARPIGNLSLRGWSFASSRKKSAGESLQDRV